MGYNNFETIKKYIEGNQDISPQVALKSLELLNEELGTTELLYIERQKLLDVMPECPVHGPCVPYAIEWVREQRSK